MNEKIDKMIEQSPVWAELNATAKAKAVECGVELSDEAYQKLRDIFILKTMLDDKEVFQAVADDMWETLQANEAQ